MKRLIAIFLFLVLCITTSSVLASAETDDQPKTEEPINMTELFEAKSFTSSKGTKINYRIFFPKDYNPQKKYPLILFLHGLGQRGSDNSSQLNLGICEPFKNPNSEIYQCIVVAPQCPGDALWVDTKQMWDVYCDYDSTKVAETAPLAAMVELFRKTRDENAVDENRVYVTGISMGGFGTWDLLVRHPLLFTAAMPLCGGADYRKASVVKDIPIWTFHGQKDAVVPCRGTEKMVAELEKIGGNITYTPYPEHGHNIWEDIYKRDDIFPWLLSQKFSDRFPDQYEEYKEPEKETEKEPTGQEDPQNLVPEPEIKKSSCQSTAEGIAPAILTASAAALALRKKKKEKE
ncbi:MAG: phospholipase [Ruminococcaceae bacterium]|nr:phospholipase [Oscillospiraceae bacterium]